ncbi:GNAT family N-acetyltransferase [Vibrio nigripulchritudo]|nr:GNAT family N-acetyltransferase [Vibrio nigripulchritudo]
MESSRLRLIPPSMDHRVEMLNAIRESSEELGEYLPWVPHALDDKASIDATNRAIENFQTFENELRYSIFEKSTGTFVGVIGLIIRNKDIPYFEIGYWLRSTYAGRGYMTEAVSTIESHAFDTYKARRLEIKMAESNIKSRAVAERCGYLYEGTLKFDKILPNGDLNSTVIYAKTR